ncbi:MAG: helix-turn-helix domain-containing protein [Bacteroidales bacterium]
MEQIQLQRYYFNEDLIITCVKPQVQNIAATSQFQPYLDKIGMIRFILILSGELELIINYGKHNFTENTLVEIFTGGTMSYSKISNDLYCYEILVSIRFMEDTILDKKPIPISHFVDIRTNPGAMLSEYDANSLKISICRIIHYLKHPNHNYKKELLYNTFHNFMLELGNIFMNVDKRRSVPQKISRKDELIQQYITLINEYGKAEHSPAFYSNKLCISTQYLSLILKERSGRTAGYWIAANLITIAKIMLRMPSSTIQHIADELNFSDQASFGKFFKKYTGIAPKKYRDQYSSM